jgi:hypothetical protein
MKQYLLSIYQPDDDPPPPAFLERVMRDVEALNQELKAAGAWIFAAGLHAPSTATVVQFRDGDLLMIETFAWRCRPTPAPARWHQRITKLVGDTLFDPTDAAQAITVGTPTCDEWLHRATTFANRIMPARAAPSATVADCRLARRQLGAACVPSEVPKWR